MSLVSESSIPQTSTKSDLAEIISGAVDGLKIHPAAQWKDYSSLGAGTASFLLVEVCEITHIQKLAALASVEKFRLFPLGGGTNIIGSDEPLQDTVFVKLARCEAFTGLRVEDELHVVCGAANGIRQFLDFAVMHGLGGVAGLCGIPGTIGGALKMNAGANGQFISDMLADLQLVSLRDGTIQTKTHAELDFGYRTSNINSDSIVISARFALKHVIPAHERELFNLEFERRKSAPKGRSAGCIFKNPSTALPAGLLLDKCGVKNLRNGNFTVAEEHANWIINKNETSTALSAESDLLKTAAEMAAAVNRKTGIVLTPEVEFMNPASGKKVADAVKRLKILVLKGGVSSEREVSLESAANVANNLRIAGHDVWEYDIKELAVTEEMRDADVVYPILHGGFGEDGRLQEMLENAGIKFVGASSKACRLVMDKVESKKVMDRHGIRNARYAVLCDADSGIPEHLNLPLIVKPVSEGSTFGLTLVESEEQWKAALELSLKFDPEILIEEYIKGVEGTVGILLGEALPPVEIRFPGKLYDYDAKYTHLSGETEYLCPPKGISEKAQEEAKTFAVEFAKAANAGELLRVDVIVTDNGNGNVYVLEGNSMPGCTASSLLPKAAAAMGISGPEMCSRLAFSGYRKP